MRLRKKGFTLIELLVVVSIISLLATVVLSSLGSMRANAKDTKRLALFNQIEKALELYYLDNNQYPPCIFNHTHSPGNINCFQSAIAPYLSVNFEDPLTSYLNSPVYGGSGSGFYYTSKPLDNYQSYGMFIHLLTSKYNDLQRDDGGDYFQVYYEKGPLVAYCSAQYDGQDADWFHANTTMCRGGN